MALERKRKAILGMIGEAFLALPKYQNVQYYIPVPGEAYPNAVGLPSIHIGRAPEQTADLTNVSRESTFAIEIVGTVTSTDSLTLVQCDIQDDIEETLYSLLSNDSFRALATQIKVLSADPTPFALTAFGASVPILPPFGVVRVSAVVIFEYGI